MKSQQVNIRFGERELAVLDEWTKRINARLAPGISRATRAVVLKMLVLRAADDEDFLIEDLLTPNGE